MNSPNRRQLIEGALGEGLPEGTVRSLNDVPEAWVAMARRLPGLLRTAFLELVTDPSQHMYVPLFVHDVVEGGEVAAQWRREIVIVPYLPPSELLVRDVESILRLLEALPGETWSRIRPDYDHWRGGAASTGAPAIRRVGVTPDWEPGELSIGLKPSSVQLEPLDDPLVGARRWLVSRLAYGALARTGGEGAPLREVVAEDLGAVSMDARAALRCLKREWVHGNPTQRVIPGFRGQDAWYREEWSPE